MTDALAEGMLTSADIARERGWNRVRAWRWLRRIEKKYGESVVHREGRHLSISARDYGYLTARARGSFHVRISALEDASAEHEQRLEALARDLRSLRRAS